MRSRNLAIQDSLLPEKTKKGRWLSKHIFCSNILVTKWLNFTKQTSANPKQIKTNLRRGTLAIILALLKGLPWAVQYV